MSESALMKHPSWLTTGDFTEADEPLRLFAAWFEEATQSEPRDPTAMSLATVDADGVPNVRMVLMKGIRSSRDSFSTPTWTVKRGENWMLATRPLCSSTGSRSIGRCDCAARSTGSRTAEADAYFATRPRLAQIGAWASKQSAPLESRHAFEKAIALYTARFAVGTIPRPPNWTGYRLVPLLMEFWQDRPFRLHDRVEFRRDAPDATWRRTRLYP